MYAACQFYEIYVSSVKFRRYVMIVETAARYLVRAAFFSWSDGIIKQLSVFILVERFVGKETHRSIYNGIDVRDAYL